MGRRRACLAALRPREHPTFWVPDGAGWRLRLMTEEVAMPWDWPVEPTTTRPRRSVTGRRAHRPAGAPPGEDEWNRIYDVSGLADVPSDVPAGQTCISITGPRPAP